MSPLQTGKNVRVVYAAEGAFATAPAAAGAKQLRITPSAGLRLSRARIDSREIRADGQSSMPRLGSRSVAGSYGIELSTGVADDLLAALLRGTWAADLLTPGVPQVRPSFTFEQQALDIDASERFRGCRVSSGRFSFPPNDMATVEFGIVGADMDVLQGVASPFFTAPYTLPTRDPFVLADATVSLDGTPVLRFTGAEFTVDLRAATQPVIGSNVTPEIFDNNMVIEGRISTLRADAALQSSVLAETESDLVITLEEPGAGTGSLVFTLPRIKFLDFEKSLGDDNAMIATLPFVAAVDAGVGRMISIARTT